MCDVKTYCTGNRSSAVGADVKVVPNGKCNHPNKREVTQEYLLDGLPIPEWAWTHCMFCYGDECVYAGECEHRKTYRTEGDDHG